jgi:hypothetical protein
MMFGEFGKQMANAINDVSREVDYRIPPDLRLVDLSCSGF